MTRLVLGVLVAGWACSTVGSVPARAQEPNEPGMPTVAEMFVLNRSASEAIPVVLHPGFSPQPVMVIGAPAVNLAPGATVGTRVSRQEWEYRRVTFTADEDPTSELDDLGAEGWEAVGVVNGGGNRRALILKRPR